MSKGLFLRAKITRCIVTTSLTIYLSPKRILEKLTVKIYEHPLSQEITVIEIEKTDEDTTFLGSIIDGFQKYGNAYPSASYADGDKKVIYLDGRRKSLFGIDDTDVLCDLTVCMTEFINDGSRKDRDVAGDAISFAEAGGHTDLLERLLVQPKAYFDSFKRVDFSGEAA